MTAGQARPAPRTGRPARLGIAAALVAACLGGAAGRAAADPDTEKADQLFAEGRALESSNLLQSCEKFNLSLRYNPQAIGTLLHVAQCEERLGRVATAVTRFAEVRDRAKELGLPDHRKAAESRIADLAPKVPHLVIQLAERPPELKIVVDDRVIAASALGDIAIDPGERVIVISAPGRLPYRAKLVIEPAEHKTLTVPPLAPAMTVASSWRRIGQITTITGGVAFAASIGMALYGRHLHNRAIADDCDLQMTGPPRCGDNGQSINNRARAYGTVATWIGGVGLALSAGGAYLWYRTARSVRAESAGQLVVVPSVSPDGAGVTAAGRF